MIKTFSRYTFLLPLLFSFNVIANEGLTLDLAILKINQEIDAKAKVSLRENLQNISRIFFENAVVTIPEPWIPKKKCISSHAR